MNPVIAATLASIGTGLFNQRSANKSMQFSSAQAARQMAFQDLQSRTQYQRAVADMKAAGLNPMLAAKLGGNAAMSGAMGSGAQATMPDIGATINSAENLRQLRPLREAQTAVQKAVEITERAKPREIEARINQIGAQIKEIEARIKILDLDEREKKLLVSTLEAAQQLDPEVYKNLKFGATTTLIDGLIEALINVENAAKDLPSIVVEFVDELGKNINKSSSGQMRRNR